MYLAPSTHQPINRSPSSEAADPGAKELKSYHPMLASSPMGGGPERRFSEDINGLIGSFRSDGSSLGIYQGSRWTMAELPAVADWLI